MLSSGGSLDLGLDVDVDIIFNLVLVVELLELGCLAARASQAGGQPGSPQSVGVATACGKHRRRY